MIAADIGCAIVSGDMELSNVGRADVVQRKPTKEVIDELCRGPVDAKGERRRLGSLLSRAQRAMRLSTRPELHFEGFAGARGDRG